jgi:hypothetical protein
MRAAALLAVLLWQAATANQPPVAQPGAMLYERAIRVGGGERQGGSGQVCAVLDAQIFPHAAPSLSDVRIFSTQQGAPGEALREVPYAITLSEAATDETEAARLLNLRAEPGASKGSALIAFDLEMPQRAYTDVTLDLDPAVHDFIATATVIGTNDVGPGGERDKSVDLGTFRLFDLASQRLSRDTTIQLQESRYRTLHVDMNISPATGNSAARFAPAMVLGATVPPSREAQSVYTTVAETSVVVTKGREMIAMFVVPARVPVERVSFELAQEFAGNFSRAVKVTALADGADDGGRAALPEVVTGSIQRVHSTDAAGEIRTEQLAVDAILGANLQRAAKVEVAIDNDDEQPLPVAAVRLEMRQRKICFEAPVGGASLALFYGDSRLAAPAYNYARLFMTSQALVAELGPEKLNPKYRAPAAEVRPFTARHPELLWIALIAVLCTLGMVALKAARNVGR